MRNSIIDSMAVVGTANDRSPVRVRDEKIAGGGASFAGALLQSLDLDREDGDTRPSRGGGVPRNDGGKAGFVTDIAIRIIGLLAVALSAAIFRWLYADIHLHPATEASIVQLVFAAIAFLSASIGCGFLALGRHVHDRIEVAERWRPRL